MRVLVTGGAGFIGSHLVDHLLADGHEVLVVDDLSTGNVTNLADEVEMAQVDIGSPKFVKVVQTFKPQAITHCAAQPSVVVSMAEPVHDARTNIVGGLNVAEAAAASGCQQFVYITTGGALYGHPEYLPMDEQHPIRPISAYGLSKWTLERYLKLLLPQSAMLKVLRLANVFGPRQDPHGEAGVISIFGERMVRGDLVRIFGDGEQTRDFVYVGDVARAHDLALRVPRPVTVNISSGLPTTVNELFLVMAGATNYRLDPEYEPERPGEMKHSVLANDRAKRLLGWSPRTSLRKGVQATVEWLQALQRAGESESLAA